MDRYASGPDIGAVFDEHVAAEFVDLDLDATMATMTDEPYVNHVPVMTGGVGREAVRSFYGQHFIGKWPADIEITPVSRTVGEEQVVDELVLSFTHDIEMPQLLPGVAPTGRHVRLAFCVVVGFEDGKVAHEHIYWDQASLLVQVGCSTRAELPVTGAEQAENVLDPRVASAERVDAGKAVASPCAETCRPALSPSSSPTSRARRGSCIPSERTAMPRRSLSTGGCSGRVQRTRRDRDRHAGDAFFVAFPTAVGAAEAALASTAALENGRVRVRIGLHTGAPTVTHEGYVGVDVHRGARVAALAHGGHASRSFACHCRLTRLPAADRPRDLTA